MLKKTSFFEKLMSFLKASSELYKGESSFFSFLCKMYSDYFFSWKTPSVVASQVEAKGKHVWRADGKPVHKVGVHQTTAGLAFTCV